MSAVIENEYTQTDTTTVLRSFTFPYLKTSDIKVSLDGVETTAFTLPNATTIQFNSVPAQNTKIKIFRQTSVDDLTATFYAGSAIKSEDLNDNFTQNLYKTQEVGARFVSKLGSTMTGDLTMGAGTDIVFEGATDDAHETTLTVADPTADRTITIPNVTGTVVTTGDTGTVARGMIAADAIDGTKLADNAVNSEHYTDGSIDRVHLAADIVDGTKIADDSINSEHYVDGSIDAAHLANNAVIGTKIATDAVNGSKIADDSIDSEHYVNASIDNEHLANNSISDDKIANNAITTRHLSDDCLDASHYGAGTVDATALASNSVTNVKMADNAVGTSEIQNDAVVSDKIAANAVTTAKINADAIISSKIADNAIGNEHLQNDSVRSAEIQNGAVGTAEIAANAVQESQIADDAVVAAKIADNAVTTGKIQDGELKTLAGMRSATASKLAAATDLTADIADLNQIDGLTKQTTISDSDASFPTSGAVVDYVAAQLAPIGGFEAIATEQAFPNTQPQSGVVISIADAGGLAVSSTGTASGQTVGGTTVNITGIATNFRGSTIAAGIRLLVTSTGSGQNYTYHKATLKEDDLVNLSGDINDFNERYRVGSSNPTSSLDNGDLFFNTSTGKLLVYNGTNSAWEEAQSIGNFFISTLSPAFNGTTQDFTITNAPSNAQQIILSINGVIQKPNAGTSTPSEGFALTGSTVKLSAAPATGSTYHAVVMGSTVNIGTPSNNTVTSAILQNGSVITSKIADDAINSDKLASSSVGTDALGSLVVTAANIASNAVTSAKLFNGAVSESKLGSSVVTTTKIADTAVTLAKLEHGTSSNDGKFLRANNGADPTFETVNTDLVGDTTPQLGGNLDSNTRDIHLNNSGDVALRWQLSGTNKWSIFHNTSSSSNHLEIFDNNGSAAAAKFFTNGAVELYHNGTKKFETADYGNLSAGQVRVSASNASTVAFSVGDVGTGFYNTGSNAIGYSANGTQKWNIDSSGHLRLNDSVQLKLGTDSDLQLYHNGSHGVIQNTTGNLHIKDNSIKLQDESANQMVVCTGGGSVQLYHSGSTKLETTSTGVSVTGNVSGSLASNFTMVDFDMHSSNTQTVLSNNQTWTADSGLGTRTISNYIRGQVVIVRAYVPMGIALSSNSGANYAEARARVNINNGSANMYSPEYVIWYRADGANTHETVQPAVITLTISASDTTFSTGDNLTVQVEGYKRTDAGSSSHFIGGWNSRKEVSIQRFARQLA